VGPKERHLIMGNTEKKKWYEHKWAVRLLLVLFYPAGLYGFIRASKKPIITMGITTLLYGGFWALVFLTPSTTVESESTEQIEVEISNDNDSSSSTGTSHLYQAAQKGDLKTVKTLLKKGKKPYKTPLAFSGLLENDEVEKDSYYIALQNGHFEVAAEISKYFSTTQYWVGREGIIREGNALSLIEYLRTHNILLPKDDVVMLITTFNNHPNNLVKQNVLSILNYLAKFDNAWNTYADFGIELSPYLGSTDIWETLVFEDAASLNQLAGRWEGSTRIYNQDSTDKGTPIEDASVFVSMEARFYRNIKKATDKYFDYKLEASYNNYLDSIVESLAQKNSIPKILLIGKKKELWKLFQQAMTGVGKKYDSEHVSEEIKLKNYSVVSHITLSAYAFEQDFSRNIYMNATGDKIKLYFSSSYISDFPWVSNFEIELDKK
jgi:hypothetical protein